ncbi:MAG: hypothetical protein AAGA48_12590 [Myxococcota bacterium]
MHDNVEVPEDIQPRADGVLLPEVRGIYHPWMRSRSLAAIAFVLLSGLILAVAESVFGALALGGALFLVVYGSLRLADRNRRWPDDVTTSLQIRQFDLLLGEVRIPAADIVHCEVHRTWHDPNPRVRVRTRYGTWSLMLSAFDGDAQARWIVRTILKMVRRWRARDGEPPKEVRALLAQAPSAQSEE